MSAPAASLYVGLMSGTSLDGVDGALVALAPPGAPDAFALRATAHAPMPAPLRASLLALQASGPDELHRSALAANALARLQAQVVASLLAQAGLAAGDIVAMGSHGQTVRHRPGRADDDATGYTIQINAPALLAELTGIAVVADLRSRDVAAGGQGAPLVPAFHAARFTQARARCAVLNLGGIANWTLLPPAGSSEPLRGFDCGPANVLLDAWAQRHLGQPFDKDGAWAASGQVHAPLLARLLAEPYFALPPPKSTGRDLFNLGWLDAHLAALDHLAPVDVQATLLALTVRSAADALRLAWPYAPGADAAAVAAPPPQPPSAGQPNQPQGGAQPLWVCGGGAANAALMQRLADAVGPRWQVRSTASAGLPPQWVEAAAFAWLAWAHHHHLPGQHPLVTGARGLRVLGARYPA